MNRADAIAAGIITIFAAVATYEAAKLPFGAARNPGPGFFPWWASVALALLALLLLWQALRAPHGRESKERGAILKVGGLIAVLGGYLFLLEPLGYPLTTFLLALFMLRVTEPHRWPVALGTAGLAAFGSYLLFAIWLKVPLPPGLLAR